MTHHPVHVATSAKVACKRPFAKICESINWRFSSRLQTLHRASWKAPSSPSTFQRASQKEADMKSKQKTFFNRIHKICIWHFVNGILLLLVTKLPCKGKPKPTYSGLLFAITRGNLLMLDASSKYELRFAWEIIGNPSNNNHGKFKLPSSCVDSSNGMRWSEGFQS